MIRTYAPFLDKDSIQITPKCPLRHFQWFVFIFQLIYIHIFSKSLGMHDSAKALGRSKAKVVSAQLMQERCRGIMIT